MPDYYDRDLRSRDRRWQARQRLGRWITLLIWTLIVTLCAFGLYYFYRHIDIQR